MPITIIQEARVFDGSRLLPAGTAVVLDGNRIIWTGHRADLSSYQDAERVEGGGHTLMPGLIDCHAHLLMGGADDPALTPDRALAQSLLRAVANARSCLEMGVTAVRDLGARTVHMVDLAAAIETGEVSGPEVIAAARFIAPRDGYFAGTGRECDTPDDARTAAEEQVAAGARVLKAIASPVPPRPGDSPVSDSFGVEALRAVAEVAHANGLKMTVHAHGLAGAKDAIAAGTDCVEHGYRLDQATVTEMATKGIWLVPTMVAMEAAQAPNWAPGRPDDAAKRARDRWEAAVNAVRMASTAGVRIAAGSDGTSGPRLALIRREALLLVEEGGLSPEAALRAATSGAAELLGIDGHTGAIAPGKRADLLMVEGDSLSDPRCLERVAAVWRAGSRVV